MHPNSADCSKIEKHSYSSFVKLMEIDDAADKESSLVAMRSWTACTRNWRGCTGAAEGSCWCSSANISVQLKDHRRRGRTAGFGRWMQAEVVAAIAAVAAAAVDTSSGYKNRHPASGYPYNRRSSQVAELA